MDTNPRADRAQITEKVPSFERFFEQEHPLTDRILDCATAIVKQLRALPDGATISRDLYAAMALLVYLNENFADQTHLAQEEAAIPLAVARGMPSRDVEWVYSDHDQGHAYAKAAGVAWGRINAGDETDLPHAIDDFACCTEGLVKMFAYHAEREDHSLFPEMARYLSDDDLIMHVITQIGPRMSHRISPLLRTWNRHSAFVGPIRLRTAKNRLAPLVAIWRDFARTVSHRGPHHQTGGSGLTSSPKPREEQ